MKLLCKDCRHITLSKHSDPLMQLAECSLTTWTHPVNGLLRGRNCFDERISNDESKCGKDARHFVPRLESVA